MFSQLLLVSLITLAIFHFPVSVMGQGAPDTHHLYEGEPEKVTETAESQPKMDHAMGHHHEMHSMHDMDMNGTDMDMDMMKMYFHTSLGDTLLFKGWKLESTASTIVACIVFFIMAVLYEGLKSYREFLFTRGSTRRCYSVSVINTVSSAANGCPENCNGGTSGDDSKGTNSCKMLSWAHFYQSLLHVIQIVTSYTLMLAFMSFNIWVCLAIALGAGHGYFLFCWKRIAVVDITEHCN